MFVAVKQASSLAFWFMIIYVPFYIYIGIHPIALSELPSTGIYPVMCIWFHLHHQKYQEMYDVCNKINVTA